MIPTLPYASQLRSSEVAAVGTWAIARRTTSGRSLVHNECQKYDCVIFKRGCCYKHHSHYIVSAVFYSTLKKRQTRRSSRRASSSAPGRILKEAGREKTLCMLYTLTNQPLAAQDQSI